ncbi:MAG: ATP synthase F1 subunit delta [Candidatus Doudnabacteria bacterium RIFCSPHIGHO2_02_FULL_48_21]|nr:MAG: ATP synthase F1 subunit delta [Candidatus Doudnabacteria bacterium RIFCSPHIGHO2_01_FULL_48_180]OGE94176.1 MAG: ATP synthase F1 subunit delta [Candidatus Doudnabacteria bacterium RIFCSPHIGHO2_02_FULL_48_21]OGF02098.1 MAG: ATP synthase F1 subunit delta [Candidatus Doudnabacteria bacterium RIFCSPLOWO2_12_FULL_47_12]
MRYSVKQYAQVLYEALHDTQAKDQEKILDNFVAVLKQNGDLGKFAEIEDEFTAYEKTTKGIKTAQVTTARKLSEHEAGKLIKEMNDYLGAKVELKQKIDAGVLGGVLIQVEDKLIDGSIKRNLQDLKNNLSES